MASQTLVVSSFTPKLAAFNSRSTRPQLALPTSPPKLNYCSSSLPTPSLHLKPFNFKSDFKCQVATTKRRTSFVTVGDGAPNLRSGTEIPEYVTALGQYAVDEANTYWPETITFKSVTNYTRQQVQDGWNYTLWIAGTERGADQNYIAEVHVPFPLPKELMSFVPAGGVKPTPTEVPEYVTALGQYAVDEANMYWPETITFKSVTTYTRQQVQDGWNYTLWIAGTEGGADQNYIAEVHVPFPLPKQLMSFVIDASPA